jgi:hypothetical protein
MRSRSIVVIAALLVVTVASTRPAVAQPQSVTITIPGSDVTFDEAGEYATLVWNDPWDMSQPLDIQQLNSGHAVYPNHFNAYSPCSAGLWCGQVRSDVGNPDLFLLTPGYLGALHVGRDGHLRPINAGQYTRLTFRMWLDQVPANYVGWQVMWTTGTVADFCNPSVCGQTVFLPLFQGWNIYSVDLSTTLLTGMAWSGNITGLRLDIGSANMQNRIVYLDWARLSGSNGDNSLIGWNTNEGGNVTVEFTSADGATTPYRPVEMSGSVGQLHTISAGAGPYLFQGSLPPDDWHVNLLTAINSFATSPGRWRIQAAPTLTFVRPSYTSGDDYATKVKGDPWDMNNPEDVGGGVVNAEGTLFGNGILSSMSQTTGNTTCVPGNCNPTFSDPQTWFLTNPLPAAYNIDTNRFRYVTFKLKVDGTPDISYGYIARVFWPYAPCGYSNDIPLQADWNVVSLDLWDNSILDDQAPPGCNSLWRAASLRTEVRLDPHEIPIATTFYLDYVLLTAMDTAPTSSDFPIQYVLGKQNVSVTFYYNTTRSTVGRQPVNVASQGVGNLGPFQLFLPSLFNQPTIPGVPPGAQTLFWHLAGVSPNTYYLSADVSDGSTITTWFSDTPVVVTP